MVESSDSWVAQEEQLCQKVDKMLAGEKLDAIVCVAGGWAGGNAASKGKGVSFSLRFIMGKLCFLFSCCYQEISKLLCYMFCINN